MGLPKAKITRIINSDAVGDLKNCDQEIKQVIWVKE